MLASTDDSENSPAVNQFEHETSARVLFFGDPKDRIVVKTGSSRVPFNNKEFQPLLWFGMFVRSTEIRFEDDPTHFELGLRVNQLKR